MTRIIEPLNPEARGPHQRIMVKLAYALADEIKRRERKLKKGDGKNAE